MPEPLQIAQGAAPATTSPMITDGLFTEFNLAMALALFTILVFAYKRFDEPTFAQEQDLPETSLKPSFLANPRDFLQGFILYITFLTGFFFLLTFLGPNIAKVLVGDALPKDIGGSLPVWLALALTGVIPNVIFLNRIEFGIRELAHAIAKVPRGTMETADRLHKASFQPGDHYLNPANRNQEPLSLTAPGDFAADASPILNTWARTCSLVWRLSKYSATEQVFDAGLLARCNSQLRTIEGEINHLSQDIAEYRRQQAAEPGTLPSRTLYIMAEQLYRRVIVLASCAARHRHPTRKALDEAFESIGFKLPVASHVKLPVDALLVTAGITALVLAAVWLVWSRFAINLFPSLEGLGKGNALPFLPLTGFDVGVLAVNTFVQTLAAASFAVCWRAWRISSTKWQSTPVDYAVVSIGSGIIGLLAVMAAAALTQSLEQGSIEGVANTPLAPMLSFLWPTFATALVSLLALRGSLVAHWPKRSVEILLPALILGSFAWISASDSWRILLLSLPNDILRGTPDQQQAGMNLFVGGSVMMGTVAGLALGAALPYFHRKSFTSPSNPDDITQLKEFHEAASRLYGEEKGWAWMVSPLPELGYITPAEAINFRAKFIKVAQMVQLHQSADSDKPLFRTGQNTHDMATTGKIVTLERNSG